MAKTDLRLAGSGDYALVADRIALFYARYPTGRIITELVSRSEREVTFRALVYRLPDELEPAATGWASEREGDGDVNAVACLENTETSAIGRALANLGFAASLQRPSAEEMAKAARARARLAAAVTESPPSPPPVRLTEERPVSGQYDVRNESPRLVAEPVPGSSVDAPADPYLLADVRMLLATAERAGLRPTRAAAVRDLLDARPPRAAPLESAERWLRGWLGRRPPVAPATAGPAPSV